MNLRQAVHRLRQQLRRGMFVLVKLLVHRRRFQPEIGGQIEHLDSLRNSGGRELGRHAVRQRQETPRRRRCGSTSGSVNVRVDLSPKPRENIGHGFPGVLSRRELRDLDVRMAQQQSDQFLTRIAAGSDDGCFCFFHGCRTVCSLPAKATSPEYETRGSCLQVEICWSINASRTGSACARRVDRTSCAPSFWSRG